jgi:hypothetical protein
MTGETKPYKAIVAFVLSIVVLVWADLEGRENWGTLSFEDWTRIIVPALIVGVGTYITRNPAVTGRHQA